MKYIAFCDTPEYEHEQRSVAPSAISVVSYMADVFAEYDRVDIISPSRTLCRKGFFKGRTTRIADKISLRQPPSFGVRTKVGRLASVLFTNLWTVQYLLRHTKRREKIVVYHSLATIPAVRFIKAIKHCPVVMEIREIYSCVTGNERQKAREIRYIRSADQYIFATELLNSRLNPQNKPYLIATGVYRPARFRTQGSFGDGRIHVVYAGTLDPVKGGAVSAVDTALYLDNRYSVHILGYGEKSQICEIKERIQQVSEQAAAEISYDGVLYGEQFEEFIQKCDIGLSTQNPSGSFNDTSFPSKVLTYLVNGLDVVSIRIPAVEQSAVGGIVTYFGEQNASEIALAVKKVINRDAQQKKQLLSRLDSQLRIEVARLFKNNENGGDPKNES